MAVTPWAGATPLPVRSAATTARWSCSWRSDSRYWRCSDASVRLAFWLARAAALAPITRPAVVRVPRWALRVVLGPFADDVLASQRAVPAALLRDGFTFEHPDLASAARWLVTELRRR